MLVLEWVRVGLRAVVRAARAVLTRVPDWGVSSSV